MRGIPGHSRRPAITWAFVAVVLPAIGVRGEAPQPKLPKLKAHVETLASPEFEGRRGEGGRKAAEYLIEAFRGLGLEPLFDGSYTQAIPGKEPGAIAGRNVGARLLGADPALGAEWVVVSAHFDHLGVRDGVLFPGADDNASGVAMMLEVARCLADPAHRPRRSVMFVGFDLEEIGLFGSRHFADDPPVPLDRVALFLTADMIGRSLGGVGGAFVFAFGTEHAPGLRPAIERAADGREIRVGMLGTDLMIGPRSDYGPFQARKVPFLFFTTGENPRYHRPDDTPESLDYPKLEAISRTILGVVRRVVDADERPEWVESPDNPFGEAVVVRDLLRSLLEHRDDLEIPPAVAVLMRNALRNLDAVVARGTITPAERSAMVRIAQVVLVSVL